MIELPRVNDILVALGLSAYRDHPARDYYMGRGKALHKAIELSFADNLDEGSLHPDIATGFSGFRKLCAEHRVEPWHVELPLASETMGFQTHGIDFVGPFDGVPSIVDWKNVKGSVDDRAVTLQFAAYDLLYGETHEPVEQHLVVMLRPDGTYRIKAVKAREHRTTWLACVLAHRALTSWESL